MIELKVQTLSRTRVPEDHDLYREQSLDINNSTTIDLQLIEHDVLIRAEENRDNVIIEDRSLEIETRGPDKTTIKKQYESNKTFYLRIA